MTETKEQINNSNVDMDALYEMFLKMKREEYNRKRKEYYNKNKEKILARRKENYHNREEVRERQRELNHNNYVKNTKPRLQEKRKQKKQSNE